MLRVQCNALNPFVFLNTLKRARQALIKGLEAILRGLEGSVLEGYKYY